YFQAGVLLFNLKRIRQKYRSEDLFSIATQRRWKFQDQDVLNYVFSNDVLYLDINWNTLYECFNRGERVEKYTSTGLSKQYKEAKRKPWIIHYAGTPKPWDNMEVDMAHYFWKYAKTSPFFEILIHEMNIKKFNELKNNIDNGNIRESDYKNVLSQRDELQCHVNEIISQRDELQCHVNEIISQRDELQYHLNEIYKCEDHQWKLQEKCATGNNCEIVEGLIFTEAKCVKENVDARFTKGAMVEVPEECEDGELKCDSGNALMYCTNGFWNYKEVCKNNEICKQISPTNAVCVSPDAADIKDTSASAEGVSATMSPIARKAGRMPQA
ncbi:MAG: hypothetical protein IIY06_06290, partial [Proteobacteria bacterium]|nr:hypothetical protein [Pseudomonadota bacterium]